MNCDALRNTLQGLADREQARGFTGNLYYDLGYPGLVAAGEVVMRGENDQQSVVVLAHGIAGWNRGYGSAPNAHTLIHRHGIDRLDDLIRVVEGLRAIACDPDQNGQWTDGLHGAVEVAQRVLGIHGRNYVTVASKLLHFLCPRYVPPFDTNVTRALECNGNRDNFVEYVICLWHLGLHQEAANGNGLAQYWEWADQGVTPLRAVDCTLYVQGANQRR
jgi:hypothetical protein